MLAVARGGVQIENAVLPLCIITALIIVRVAMGRLDRSAIRDSVAGRKDSKVVSIHWDPVAGWFSRAKARYYDVVYRKADGRRVDARCTVTFFGGVEWISSTPVGTIRDEQVREDKAEESCPCAQCGASIPAATTRCPRCGWSYQQ